MKLIWQLLMPNPIIRLHSKIFNILEMKHKNTQECTHYAFIFRGSCK